MIYVKHSDSWVLVNKAWQKVAGSWLEVPYIYNKNLGTWVEVHRTRPQFVFNYTIAADTTAFDLRDELELAGWDGEAYVTASVVVNVGVVVGSASIGGYAFSSGSAYPAGSSLTLEVNGTISGKGGSGGNGGTGLELGNEGTHGSPALFITSTLPTILTFNATGKIYGGGGGGGGGGSTHHFFYDAFAEANRDIRHGGGGGGAGAGASTSAGGFRGGFTWSSPPDNDFWGIISANGNHGGSGTISGNGAGGNGYHTYFGSGRYVRGGSGGNGGGFSNSGSAGYVLAQTFPTALGPITAYAGGPAGLGANAIVGISNITLIDNGGTIIGASV